MPIRMQVLGHFFVGILIAAIAVLTASPGAFGAPIQSNWPLGNLYNLAALIPGIAVQVHRLHDIDRSRMVCPLTPSADPILLLFC